MFSDSEISKYFEQIMYICINILLLGAYYCIMESIRLLDINFFDKCYTNVK